MLRMIRPSLRTRIVAWSFVPTIIILLAVALVTFYAYQQVTEDLVVGRNLELTRLSAGQLNSGLRDYTDLMNSVARTSDIYEANPERPGSSSGTISQPAGSVRRRGRGH